MITKERERELAEIEKKLGISFLNKALLNQALTHSSYAHEIRQKGIYDNERLEFLGDAVLKLVVSEYLYNKFPGHQEGDLTKIRAVAISDDVLSIISARLRIGNFILLGANERRSGGRERKSILANVFEAIIAAVYLDGGIGKARDLILSMLSGEIEKLSAEGYIKDFKSALQELVQKKGWGLPNYVVINETGPRHKKIFLMEVRIKGRPFGKGRGLNKKEAEQDAAKGAYNNLTRANANRNPIRRVGGFIKKIMRKPNRNAAPRGPAPAKDEG